MIGRTPVTHRKARRNRRRLRITVRRSKLRTGRQAGVEVVDLDNGRLSLRVCPTRGMGILCAAAGNLRLGWDSPAGLVVHPRHIDLRKRGGTGWLDGFTELVVRCGLRNIGRPGWDAFRSVGRARREFLTLHGSAANLPAREVRINRHASGVSLSGVVVETAGDDVLELRTTISLSAGAAGFRIVDIVTNRGKQPAEFQLLYHSNFGAPLLAEGTRFLAPINCLAGMDAHAARRAGTFDRYRGPTPGFREEVYLVRLLADRRGRSIVALANQQGDAAVSIEFAVSALPCLTLWKQTGTCAERYVTGLEPGTSFPNHRSVERKHSRVKTLAPGESYRAALVYRVHRGAVEMARLRRRIASIQGSVLPKILSLARFNVRGNDRPQLFEPPGGLVWAPVMG